jgi:hypothetical protein
LQELAFYVDFSNIYRNWELTLEKPRKVPTSLCHLMLRGAAFLLPFSPLTRLIIDIFCLLPLGALKGT